MIVCVLELFQSSIMPRPLRIEYEGARYRVMCRGNRRATVFGLEQDVGLFLKTLGEVCARTDWKVHAWVLMSTHYPRFRSRRTRSPANA